MGQFPGVTYCYQYRRGHLANCPLRAKQKMPGLKIIDHYFSKYILPFCLPIFITTTLDKYNTIAELIKYHATVSSGYISVKPFFLLNVFV